MMKKLLFSAPGQPALVETPAPEISDDTILLRTLYSGLSNGTERNQLLGLNYNPDRTFPFLRAGYQTTSVVERCGDQITRYRVGDLVATGTFGTHAELHIARESDLISPLPPDFDPVSGALLSIAAVAHRNVDRAAIGAGDKVLICGAGPIGLLALQIARLRGARVLVLTRGAEGARLATALGADAAVYGDAEVHATFLAEHHPFTVAIESTGSVDLLQRLIGTSWGEGVFGTRSRGRLVMLAGYDEVRYRGNAAQAGEIAILHSGHFAPQDHATVIDLVHTKRLQIRPLIRRQVPVADIVSVYETLRDHPSEVGGTVFDWTPSSPSS